MASKPFLFQLFMPDDVQFNHELILDFTWLEPMSHRPALHIVDRGTHFSLAEFLQGESAEDIWNTFVSCWVSIYVGFPNILSHDFGSAFSAKFFEKACAEFGIITKEIPSEAHNAIGPGERYDKLLKLIYNKLKDENPDMGNDLRLSIANHALNITANAEGLVPTLLVFGTVPKIPLGNVSIWYQNKRKGLKLPNLLENTLKKLWQNQD